MSATVESITLSTDPIRNLVLGASTGSSGSGSTVCIGINDDSTRLVVSYQGNYSPRLYTYNGSTWSSPTNLFTSATNSNGTNQITMSPNGSVVVYVGGTNIYIGKWNGTTYNASSTVISIGSTICLQCGINFDGSTFVYKMNTVVYLAKYNNISYTYESSGQLVSCFNYSNMAMTRSGNRIAFTTGDPANGSIYFSDISSNGGFTNSYSVSTNLGYTFYTLTFSYDENGSIVFVGSYGKSGSYVNRLHYLIKNTTTYGNLTEISPTGMFTVSAATQGRMGGLCYTSNQKLYYCQWTPRPGNVSVLNVSITTPPIPITNFSINLSQTITVSTGNLQVSITDPNNSASNKLYYWYSIHPVTIPNANSYVLNTGSSGSPYKFYINVSDISNIIYVQGKNATGNTSIVNTSLIVYKTPRVPPLFNVSFVGSGNVQVTIGESSLPPTDPYYYLNNVSYLAYLYTGGTNQSGNISYYSTNVGILANTNTTYGNIVSYISGVSANMYTVYLVAKNTIGNTIPYTTSRQITVYTTPIPPVIDSGNTKSTTSGNLTVSFTDPSNNPNNAISYWYYVYDSSIELYYG